MKDNLEIIWDSNNFIVWIEDDVISMEEMNSEEEEYVDE